MAGDARYNLLKKHNAGTLGFSGFQDKYVGATGAQGSGAQVHILGVAGSALAGALKAINGQFAEDKNQLQDAIKLKSWGRTTVPAYYGYGRNFPIDRYIEEKQAEIEDDRAGIYVANFLEDKIDGRITSVMASVRITNLLCK